MNDVLKNMDSMHPKFMLITFGFILMWEEFLVTRADIFVKYETSTPSRIQPINGTRPRLSNKNAQIVITCLSASGPVEWVFDFDTLNKNHKLPNTQYREVTSRDHNFQNDTTTYFTTVIYLGYDHLTETETLKCRSTLHHNYNDVVIVELVPSGNNFSEIRVEFPEAKSLKFENTSNVENLTSYNFEISVLQRLDGFYLGCTINGSFGSVMIYGCGTASECANTFRKLKKTCSISVTMIRKNSEYVHTSDSQKLSFWKLQPSAGVVVCASGDSTRYKQRGAIEYFLDTEYPGQQTLDRKLYLHWTDVSPEDLIIIAPDIRSLYYLNSSITAKCYIPRYGFSFYPAIIIKRDGIIIREDQNIQLNFTTGVMTLDISIDFSKDGIGNYEVYCMAAVWNTTQYAAKTAKFTVKRSTPPYFLDSSINITLYEGEKDRSISCNDSFGEPMPVITWSEPAQTSRARPNDTHLTFVKVSKEELDGITISCTATNEFGEAAIKSFQVFVTELVETSQVNDFTTLVIICGLLLIFVCLVVTIGAYKYTRRDKQIVYLNSAEVNEFRHGKPKSSTSSLSQLSGENNENMAIDCIPFNSDYEISRERLIIDFDAELGSGKYGVVHKGILKGFPKVMDTTTIAVKTVRKDADLMYFKALISELKIMTHIGQNKYLVNLIGAWTTEIENRELYVVVELCKTSLIDFFKCDSYKYEANIHRTIFRSKKSSKIKKTGLYSMFDLLTWSNEVAKGMEFIGQKKVVHADLAARNILLTSDFHAKICDFGLARQLVNYQYIRSKSIPVPWKWMAIESLYQKKFSRQSDVWSYGIVLYEIFTLGEEPYIDRSCTTKFMRQLEFGMRLNQPDLATNDIYDVMLKCWRKEPQQRPKFSDIKRFFDAYLQHYPDIPNTTNFA